jgi:hypothetical protein
MKPKKEQQSPVEAKAKVKKENRERRKCRKCEAFLISTDEKKVGKCSFCTTQ